MSPPYAATVQVDALVDVLLDMVIVEGSAVCAVAPTA
jgi:hypothetical protein